MNRISIRVWALLLFVAVLLGGFGFFLSEYFTKGSGWHFCCNSESQKE